MLWQGTTKVGFGVHGKYVVAWYCEDKAEATNTERALKNIGKSCLDNGYNDCYNEIALKAVNKSRINHSVSPLKLNEGAAREIDYHLSAQRPGDFYMPDPSDRGWKYTGCYQSVFLESDVALRPKVSSTAAAPQYWYDGASFYDYVRGQPKEGPSGWIEESVGCL